MSYLDIHMAVLYQDSYQGSCHSSVNADTPNQYNEQAILFLKVFRVSNHFYSTTTTLPTRAWYIYLHVYF